VKKEQTVCDGAALLSGCLEIMTGMQAAAGVELSAAGRTNGMAGEVVTHRQFITARPAQDSSFSKPGTRPDSRFPASEFLMAFVTWKILAAAIELDGNPVNFRMVMKAARFTVHLDASHFLSVDVHHKPPYTSSIED